MPSKGSSAPSCALARPPLGRRVLDVAQRGGDGRAHSAFLEAFAVNVFFWPNHWPST